MSSYARFLAAKERAAGEVGITVRPDQVHPLLFDWQAKTVRWAVKKGRCAVWFDCGMGKSPIQLEWARLSGDTSLIMAPLSVARQTADIEAPKVDMTVRYVRSQSEVTGPGVYATNYEMAHAFDPSAFDAVVYDESSIVKHHTSETRRRLCTEWAVVPRRLACTATPAPNDVAELTNHAELLGVMPRAEMLAAYFIHDDEGWRLKGHAVEPMWKWISSWAITAQSPADLGYPNEGFALPGLNIYEERVDHEIESPDQLFATDIGGVGGRASVRRQTLDARVRRVVSLMGVSPEAYALRNGRTEAGSTAGVRTAVAFEQPREGGAVRIPDCASAEASDDRGAEGGAQGVRTTVEQSQSGSGAGVSTEDCGQEERRSKAEVLGGSVLQRSAEGAGAGIPETHPDPSVPSGAKVQGRHWRSGVDDEQGVCDLPRSSRLRPNGQDARRPRSQDGEGPGRVVSVVQPGVGSRSRRSTSGGVDAGVPLGGEPWIIWCGLNDEQDDLARLLGDRAISIYGSLTAEEKERRLNAWLAGERPILLTKPSVCGVGLNLQRAHKMAFVGIGDSYEAYYQAIRRCYRFGQTEPVDAHIIVSAIESQIVANVRRKEQQDRSRIAHLVRYSREELSRVD